MKAVCIYVVCIALVYVAVSAALRWLAFRDAISNPFDIEEHE
jgi:hypothetical protein